MHTKVCAPEEESARTEVPMMLMMMMMSSADGDSRKPASFFSSTSSSVDCQQCTEYFSDPHPHRHPNSRRQALRATSAGAELQMRRQPAQLN